MKKRLLYIVAVALSLSSCINNDVPYPYVKGEVSEFTVDGQISAEIDNDLRKITVVLNEEADITKANVSKFAIKNTDLATTDFTTGTKDLSKTVEFNIEVYHRQWDWKIETTQPIERFVNVENQKGAAQIDFAKKTAHFELAKYSDIKNVTVTGVKLAPASATYSVDLKTITDFTNPVEVTVSYRDITEKWMVSGSVSASRVDTDSINVWANTAYFYGSIEADSQFTPSFEYREDGSDEWISVSPVIEGGEITAKVAKLKELTKYIGRAKLDDEYGVEIEFTTEDAPLIPNMGFDDWTIATDNKTWYPNSTATYEYWGSGNAGVLSTMGGGKTSNVYPTEDAVRGKAACLESVLPGKVFAAGSVYTGGFKISIPTTRSAKFAKPYAGRPTKMSFWYKYLPQTIDSAPTVHKDSIGNPDMGTVYIYLGSGWKTEGMTSDKLKKAATVGVVAFGEFKTKETVGSYTKHTIHLEYYDKKTIPTHVIIAASSSLYGDLFVGGIGSKLFLDEIEFEFD